MNDRTQTPPGLQGSPPRPEGFPFPPEAFCRHCQVRMIGSGVVPCRSRTDGRAPGLPCEAARPAPVGRAAALDSLSRALQAAQGRMYDLNLGASASVTMGSGAVLMWAKVEDVWGFHIESTPTRASHLLGEATAALRVEAAPMLAPLLAEVTRNLDVEVGAIEEATRAARQFASDL